MLDVPLLKFIVSPDGLVVDRFASLTKPYCFRLLQVRHVHKPAFTEHLV